MSVTYSGLGRCGRFANQGFQVAGTIALARKSGQEFCFPEWKNWDASERFGTTEDIDVQKYFVNPLPPMPEGRNWHSIGYFWGYQDLILPAGDWDLSSLHFQSEKFWLGHEEAIRHYLKMKDEPDYIDATAIHWRAGDYSGWNEGYHPRCSIEYYRKALEHVTGEIYLFSDDLEGVSKMFDELKVKYTLIDKGYIESFAIMKRCKHFVTANSSYSMLAAMLADQTGKKIIAPSQWFGPSFGGGYKEMSKDIYPENCLVL